MLEQGNLVALGQVVDTRTLGLGVETKAGGGWDDVHGGIVASGEWRVASG
jgi:hypothetical protein